jgi:hypothetical protein
MLGHQNVLLSENQMGAAAWLPPGVSMQTPLTITSCMESVSIFWFKKPIAWLSGCINV